MPLCLIEKNKGFTLVELSIVLVILGLLVGGVLSGQSLIRAAELRSVNTQLQQYTSATYAFRDKYSALPGDMPNATKFWGAVSGSCISVAATGSATCDGDGDGRVYPTSNSNESFRYWQHLANAKLIEGSYTGITDGSNAYSATKNNVPSGKIGNTLWFMYSWGSVTTSGVGFFYGDYDNVLVFGNYDSNSHPGRDALKPEDLWGIDKKMDDGMPATGRIVSLDNFSAIASERCTDAANASISSALYKLDNEKKVCGLLYRGM